MSRWVFNQNTSLHRNMSPLLRSKTEPGPHQDRRTTANTHTHTLTHVLGTVVCGAVWQHSGTERPLWTTNQLDPRGRPLKLANTHFTPFSPPDSLPHHITSTSPHSSFSTETKPGQVIRLFLALPWRRTQKHIQASVKAIDGDDRRQLFFLQQCGGAAAPAGRTEGKCKRDLHRRRRL